jgi:hypothetical protein
MNYPPANKRLLATALVAVVMSGCASVKEDVKSELPPLVTGPSEAPARTITNFSNALRCMDRTLIDYGVYDVSMLVEDIKDSTGKVKAGAKDMLISAISEMTRRSHAVRLIAFGSDSGNLVSFLASANENTPYSVVPQYDIRGSISQLDKSVAAKDVAGGISLSDIGLGGATTANASVLALDLAIISTQDYSVIPGVVSKNTIVIFKEGRGVDGDATIGKFGINFSMNLTRSEGDAQALRNLIELAAIELVGKLTKTPYWNCLGIDPQTPEIRTEMNDWFYNLAADQQAVLYFQNQLANRGFYDGPLDGRYNAALTQAVVDYQRGVGIEANGNINEELFDALLNKPVPAPQQAQAPQPPAPPTAAVEPLAVDIRYADTGRAAPGRGEPFALLITTGEDAHLFCYFQSEDGAVVRFFPNRFQQSASVQGGAALRLPGSMPFKLTGSQNGGRERVACFAAREPVMGRLPHDAKGTDFEALPVASLESIESQFGNLLGDDMGVSYLEINTQ